MYSDVYFGLDAVLVRDKNRIRGKNRQLIEYYMEDCLIYRTVELENLRWTRLEGGTMFGKHQPKRKRIKKDKRERETPTFKKMPRQELDQWQAQSSIYKPCKLIKRKALIYENMPWRWFTKFVTHFFCGTLLGLASAFATASAKAQSSHHNHPMKFAQLCHQVTRTNLTNGISPEISALLQVSGLIYSGSLSPLIIP